jgi:hypothetical protein
MSSGFNTLPLHPYKQLLIDSMGLPCRISGISAFNLLELYRLGQFPQDFLSNFPFSNLVRIFLYTPKKDWGPSAWDPPDSVTVADFISYMAKLNWRVKLVLLTDDDSNRIRPAIDLVTYLTEFRFTNLILAAGNEPLTDKNINVFALKGVLENSGYLYTSGVYEDLAKFYGNIGDDHSGRDDQWPRKAKDIIECYRGGGPNYEEEPACKVPWILGEPIRPDQAINFGYNTVLDYYTYGALAGAMGSGGIFHFQNGKLCNTPTSFELSCYKAFTDGLNIFPLDLPLANYDRIDEKENTLRTYTMGNTAIRVRPVREIAPLAGYKSIDKFGICWVM